MEKYARILLCLILCGFVFADSWTYYDDFSDVNINSTKWGSYSENGGLLPFINSGKCVLSGGDANGGDAAFSNIYAAKTTKSVKAEIVLTEPVFNNDQGLGQVGDFQFSITADLANGMFCSIILFDFGDGLSGNAKVLDDQLIEVAANAFDATYSSSDIYTIEIQENAVIFKKGDSLLLSWQPSGDYNFTGFSYMAEGLYCTFSSTVDDVYTSDAPEYGNSYETAYRITPDGSSYYGTLSSSSDVDWFVFTPDEFSRYKIRFANSEHNGKYLTAYQIDEIGNLITLYSSMYAYNSIQQAYAFLEYDKDVYLKVNGSAGEYNFSAEFMETTLPDGYGDTCETATPVSVGATVSGVLHHLTPSSLDTDWLVFPTQANHKYEITLTRANNSDVGGALYSDDCATFINSFTGSFTVVSWFGENYKVRLSGSSGNVWQYYTITVTDLGVVSDEHPNTAATAFIIDTDGTWYDGTVQYQANYHSDEDWFRFTPIANSRYSLTVSNLEGAGLYAYVATPNGLGGYYSQSNSWVINKIDTRTLFFETSDECYIGIYGNISSYSLNVEYIDTTAPDSYGTSCENPTSINVDQQVVGTLTHIGSETSLTYDWLTFDTEPLHKYKISIADSDNSGVYFSLYRENCGANINSGLVTYTVVSWFGENYDLQIYANEQTRGHYYTIIVEDLGLVDDDYANSADTALSSIPKDGTPIAGEIQYSANYNSDEDWFKLIAPLDGNYLFTITNPEQNWKYLYLFRKDQVGNLVYITNIGGYNNIGQTTQYLTAGDYYVRLHNSLGLYQWSVLSPEPRCGDLDHPYPMGDVNEDCYFDMLDIAMMAADWLSCTDPNPPCEFMPY